MNGKYEQAGVKEYWIVEPREKILSIFILKNSLRYGRSGMYTEEDEVKVSMFDDLVIDLSKVFSFE
ncbi:Uma2 family endonuclease [Schinkia azotoformans]|uniref:Uma2 family endonuclease n=1 Tax=Schinkia azotoformans TaxID=1454 RepID=UPI00398AF10F